MKLRNLAGAVTISAVIVLTVAGTAFAVGPHMGPDGTTGLHEPGTGMVDGEPLGPGPGTHEPGTGMTDDEAMGPGPGTHEPGTGMTDDEAMGPRHMFRDAAGQWYEQHAQNMAQHGFMRGYENGNFGGHDDITRAQFAVVMARMMGIGPEGNADFSDTHGHWAEGHIAGMVRAGIIQGRTDGTFAPGAPISRAQMATMMGRALEHVGAGMDQGDLEQLRERIHTHLSDVSGHWAEDHIAHMYGLGITQGDNAGHFRPDEHTNRAQASAMLWRFYEGNIQ